MAIDLKNPNLNNWIKLLNAYDPDYYQAGKKVTAEEWNTLFLASVNQGNYLAETIDLLNNENKELRQLVQDSNNNSKNALDIATQAKETATQAMERAKEAYDQIADLPKLLETWIICTTSEWQSVNGSYRLIIPYERHKCNSPVISKILLLSADGEYENSIPMYKTTTTQSIVVLSEQPINCKIKIEGEK